MRSLRDVEPFKRRTLDNLNWTFVWSLAVAEPEPFESGTFVWNLVPFENETLVPGVRPLPQTTPKLWKKLKLFQAVGGTINRY